MKTLTNLKNSTYYDKWMERFATIESKKFGQDAIPTTEYNIELVFNNDKNLSGKIVYNMFANRTEKTGPMPWDVVCPEENLKGNQRWTDDDFSGLSIYLGQRYGLRNKDMIRNYLRIYRYQHRYHPVQKFLKEQTWDGKPRVETIFIDFFGCTDNVYTREVAKVFFVAAVKRIFEPGAKFDYLPILVSSNNGEAQGLGKSTFWEKLVYNREWFNSSIDANLGKESMIGLQGKWIVNFEELAVQRKSDINTFKAFLSNTMDTYRKPYDTDIQDFPRQCCFVANSNTDDFLRDYSGNRRFFPLDCHPRDNIEKWNKKHPELNLEDVHDHWRIIDEFLTEDYVKQFWGEAYHLYRHEYKDAKLTLYGEAARIAEHEQTKHEFQSAMYDAIEEHLSVLVPGTWKAFSAQERADYYKKRDFEEGVAEVTETSVREIWLECFQAGNRRITNSESSEIKHVLESLGWKPVGAKRHGPYGVVKNCYELK